MGRISKSVFQKTIAAACVSSLAVMTAAPVAMAKAPLAAQSSQSIDIPAGALGDVLLSISTAFDVNVIVDEPLVEGKTAPRIIGAMSVEDALLRALEGSDLVIGRSASGAFIIAERQRGAGATQTGDLLIVQGTKLANSVQETDTSVEIFTEERLDREEIVDLSNLLLRVPNVTTGSGLGNDFSIRGIGRTGATGAGTGIASNVYVDGAPLSVNALLRGPVPLWDVAQTEVLRGPQSTVQGRNALAGAIVITTNDPTYEPEAKFRATYGRFDTYQLAGAISGPIIPGQVAARIAVDYQETDGFIENTIVNRQADRRESILVRGKLLIEPDALPGFVNKVTIDYQDGEGGENSPRVTTNFGVTDPEFVDFDFYDLEATGSFPNNSTEAFRVVNDAAYDLSEDWTVRNILTYETTDVSRVFGILGDFDAFGSFADNGSESDVFSAETRFEFDYDRFRGFLGGYYYDEESSNFANNFNPVPDASSLILAVTPVESLLVLESGGQTEIENFAAFGQLEWDMTDRWRLNLGFRYDNEEVTASSDPIVATVTPETCLATVPGVIVQAPFPTIDLPCQALADLILGDGSVNPENSERFDAFLPRAALTYFFGDDHSVFVSYQRGYRAGGSQFVLTPGAAGGPNVTVLNTYDPEYLDTFEIGTRTVWLDGALTVNANAFYSSYTDQQVLLRGPIEEIASLDDTIENAGESTIYGAEFLIDYTPHTDLNLFASIGLLKTEFDDFEFATTGPFENFNGNEFPFAPNLTYTLGANYDHKSGVYANATFTYTGSRFSEPANLDGDDFAQAFDDEGLDPAFGATLTNELESYEELTLRLGYRNDRINVFAAGTNLLGVEELRSIAYGTVNSETGAVDLRDDSLSGLLIRPRSFRVGVEVSF